MRNATMEIFGSDYLEDDREEVGEATENHDLVEDAFTSLATPAYRSSGRSLDTPLVSMTNQRGRGRGEGGAGGGGGGIQDHESRYGNSSRW